MKKLLSKVAHNRPKRFFFQSCQPAQNLPKTHFLFHKNVSLHDFYIMTLHPPHSTVAEAHFAFQSILLFGNPLHCYLLLKRTVSFKLACYSLLLNTLCFSRAEHTLQPNTLCKVTIYSSALFALLPFAQKNSFLQIGLLQFAS